MPHFTELTLTTGLAYAHALAAVFGLTVADITPHYIHSDIFEYLLSDGSTAVVWLEDGHVYGEA